MSYVDKTNVGGVDHDLRDPVAVRFNEAQTLTDAQQAQARENISAAGEAEIVAALHNLSPIGSVGPAAMAAVDDAAAADAEDVIVHIKPAQAGSGTPSPSNVRTLTGWTAAKVTRAGKNLIDDSIKYAATSTNLAIGNNYDYTVPLKAGTYAISVEFLNSVHYGLYIREKNDSANTTIWGTDSADTSKAFTVPADGLYRIWLYHGSGVSASNVGQAQLEYGSAATAHETHQTPTVYNVSLPAGAGTVYGGTLDITNGVLTVDKWLFQRNTSEMNNSDSYPGWKSSGLKAATGLNANGTMNNVTMNIGAKFSYNCSGSNDTIYLGTGDYSYTQTQWIALAQDVQIIVPLATPVSYTLTGQEIALLRGFDTVWADAGDTELAYRQDVALLLQKIENALNTALGV